MKTTDAAKGKWKEILVAFGIDAAFLTGKHSRCPCTGEGDDRFRFSDQNGTGDYFCACSQGGKGGFGLLACKTGRSFKELAAEVDVLIGNTSSPSAPRAATYAEKLRAIARPAKRSRYLESRGLEMAPGLLWAKSVDYRDDGKLIGRYDAMLGPVYRAGEFQTFHVTYLEAGRKAPVNPTRKVLPGGSISGGGIELYPATEEMGVAEGIETAIAARMLFGIPTHATISAGGMAKWVPPKIARCVRIYADHDKNFAGHSGAYQLAHRLKLQGITASVHFPDQYGDWNDVLLQMRQAA